jgi:flagellar basal-body rod modification protein FlgD
MLARRLLGVRNGAATAGDHLGDAEPELLVDLQDQDFMGQMASFSTLEQVTNLATANEAIATNLQLSQSVGLIGRTVTWTDDAEQTHTGVVEKVSQQDGRPVLTVSGTEGVDPTTITQIA